MDEEESVRITIETSHYILYEKKPWSRGGRSLIVKPPLETNNHELMIVHLCAVDFKHIVEIFI